MLTALAVCALVLGFLGMLAGLLALRTLGRLRRNAGVLGRSGGGRRETFLEATARHIELTELTRAQFDDLSLGVLATLERFESGLRRDAGSVRGAFAGELDAVRAQTGAQVEATRADVAAELSQIKATVAAELAQIRAGFDAHRESSSTDIAAQRARLAADNSAAKDQLRTVARRAEQVIHGSLRRVALVHFDAFDDLSGRLSFSLALLDGRGDGVTLTSLAGRSESRVYAKPINAGQATTELSPEERQAVDAALKA